MDKKTRVYKILMTLSERQLMIMSLHYVDKLTLREIAWVLDLTPTQAASEYLLAWNEVKSQLGHLKRTQTVNQPSDC